MRDLQQIAVQPQPATCHAQHASSEADRESATCLNLLHAQSHKGRQQAWNYLKHASTFQHKAAGRG